MPHLSLQVIHDEHTALAALLKSLTMMIERGPGDDPEGFFDVLRAMLFYIDEYPERLHHTKETELLFPALRRSAPALAPTLDRLEAEHAKGEQSVRELQHLLLAWELLGQTRREAFETAAKRYLAFYMVHMRVEESEIIPAAKEHLQEDDWVKLNNAFATHCDPLIGKYPRDPMFDRLYTHIVMRAPAPIGLGKR